MILASLHILLSYMAIILNFTATREIVVEPGSDCERHPQMAFLLDSIHNFFKLQKDAREALDTEHDTIQDYVEDMVQKYTVHDLSDKV